MIAAMWKIMSMKWNGKCKNQTMYLQKFGIPIHWGIDALSN